MVVGVKLDFSYRKLRLIGLVLTLFLLVSCGGGFEIDDTYLSQCTVNGKTFNSDSVLCLQHPGGTSNVKTCCYQPDGSKCSSSDISKMVAGSARFWAEHIGLRDQDEDAVYSELYTEIGLMVDSEGCFSDYTQTIEIDSDNSFTLPGMMPYCTLTDQFDKEGIILAQEMGDYHDEDNPQEYFYLCYNNRWYTADQMISYDEDYNDGDGAAFFFDCDEGDPFVHRDMSMYAGFDEYTPANICGDGKDNSCDQTYTYTTNLGLDVNMNSDEEWTLEGDSCHKDPIACEENCLFKDEKCDYLSYSGYTEEQCEDPADPSTCTGEPEYDSGIEGQCCGAGLFDKESEGGYLGAVEDWSGSDFACLNDEFVAQGLGETDEMVAGDCPDDWCWIKSDTSELDIFTINVFGQSAYDIVSDKEEWLVCDDAADLGPRYYNVDDLVPVGGNRLYCTKEGDHYAWSECVLDKDAESGESALIYNADTIKLREVGDGGFALPVEKQAAGSAKAELGEYELIYTIDKTLPQTVDFVDYDNIEFFVKYVGDVALPANIEMTVKGKPYDSSTSEEIVYYEGNVLGYAVNAPLLEEGSIIHVRVPVGDWYDVSSVTFATFQGNNEIEVSNVFLSVEGFDDYICSGVDNDRTSSWIDDLDVSDSQTNANGEYICTQRYGDNAWLGSSEGYEKNEVESGVGASCCGNTEEEYYSGLSQRTDHAACFNSEPLLSGDTAMTVEYEVEYYLNINEVTDDDFVFDRLILKYDYYETELLEDFFWICPDSSIRSETILSKVGGAHADNKCYVTIEYVCDQTKNSNQICQEEYKYDCYSLSSQGIDGSVLEQSVPSGVTETLISQGTETEDFYCEDPSDSSLSGYSYNPNLESLEELNSFNQIVYFNGEYYVLREGEVEEELSNGARGPFKVSYEESPKVLYEYSLEQGNILNVLEDIDFELGYCKDFEPTEEMEGASAVTVPLCNDYLEKYGIEAYFFSSYSQDHLGDSTTISSKEVPSEGKLQIVAEKNQLGLELTEKPESETFSYPCLSEECRFALPGLPPYQITNSHPELYDMYYVGDVDEVLQEVLITNDESQVFEEVGSLVIRDISQQVLYIYNEEDETGNFYGCNAVYYIDQLGVLEENYGYCSVEGEFYCAYSEDSLITTWSDEGITHIGYAEVEEYTEDTVLELLEVSYEASLLNHSTNATPGRNVVSNADFEAKSGSDLDFWSVLDSSGATVDDENGFLEDESGENVFEVEAGYTLRSGKIQVASKAYYAYTEANSCGTTTITKVTKDGDEDVVSLAEYAYFPANDAVYFRIEVTGECDYSEPYLQIVDDLGAALDFEYDPDYPERAAAACCPDGMCWNGYVCVGDMAINTYMVEDTGKESMYRCIDGDWSYLEPQYDWNDEYFGFCETESQCFVTSSLSEGANSEAELADFYTGAYPTCINDGEYLLDHYCDAGDWSSRTKFVASQLLDFADSEDYVLYCSNYADTFVNYNEDDYNYMNYVGGEVSASVDSTEDLGDTLTSDSTEVQTTTVCFDALENSETGRRLVDQEENTCINSVCVLKYKSSGELTAAFGASMNINSSDDQSFLIPLGVSQSDLEEFCVSDEEGTFVECSDQLWYASEINSLIYAKNGISIGGGIVDTVVDWIVGLFSSSEEDTDSFIDEATNFNQLYLASGNGIDLRVAREKQGGNQTISAEYDFSSDISVCDFINNAPYEYVFKDQWPAEPEEIVDCQLTEEGVYKIMASANEEYWWPQLTSNLDPNVFGQRE